MYYLLFLQKIASCFTDSSTEGATTEDADAEEEAETLAAAITGEAITATPAARRSAGKSNCPSYSTYSCEYDAHRCHSI